MRRIFCFLVYSIIYLVFFGSALSYLLGVSPFALLNYEKQAVYLNPFEDWLLLYNQFYYGTWAVDSAFNLLIFTVFFFYFPLWLILWLWVRKVHWLKLFFKPFYGFFHKFFSEKIENKNVKNSVSFRPKALPAPGGLAALTKKKIEQNLQTMNPSAQSADSKDLPQNDLPQSDTTIEKTSSTQDPVFDEDKATLKEEMKAFGMKYGYDLFENVSLGDCVVPFVFSSAIHAFLIILLEQDSEWIADEDVAEDSLVPTWFSSTGLIDSPVYKVKKAASFLQEIEPDSILTPIVVLTRGSILNLENMLPIWEKEGVEVLSWKHVENNQLKTLEDFFDSQLIED